MGVPKVILMSTNDDGTKEQVYPVTDINAIEGLAEVLQSNEAKLGVTSINGQTGDVILPVLTQSDYARIMAMVTAFEDGEIGGGTGNIIFERVDEV
ncbi:hypothetical protein DOK76_12430 [Vagococcus sp. DIV0080]|uniref:Uncharacterized protein n=1 Tax=Candidatus Vagococcus giribetii TaxID=2230876 RepID=A0ABS3HVU5_9ENTE|nr:hypothetical protein [Vagococcus sp. DIV0080]MBO0477880.1 hypothetical protein [Vagococcus sp. DIV0080]